MPAAAKKLVQIPNTENLLKVYLQTHQVSKMAGLHLELKSKVINKNCWSLMKNRWETLLKRDGFFFSLYNTKEGNITVVKYKWTKVQE